MPVLIEGISVVIRVEVLNKRYPGGVEQFSSKEDGTINSTLCSDGELVKVSFMSPSDVGTLVNKLKSHGIVYINKADDDDDDDDDDVIKKAVDVAVVDQLTGFCAPCDWAVSEHQGWEGDPDKPVRVCRMVGSTTDEVVTYPGWEYERSLSGQCTFIPNSMLENQRSTATEEDSNKHG
jgi:hypothetical protein